VRPEEVHDPGPLALGRPNKMSHAADCPKRAWRDVVAYAEVRERSLEGAGLAEQDVRRKRAAVEALEQPR
jgi:hypothetical protein